MKTYQTLSQQALFALSYFLLARLGMAVFALQPSNITPLWLPSGIALVMALRWRMAALPWLIGASFAANSVGMSAFSSAVAFMHVMISASVDAALGVFAAYMFRRFLPEGLRRANDLILFAFYVCLLPTTLSSILLVFNLVVGGYIQPHAVFNFTGILIAADSLGMLLVFPIYQGWCERVPLSRECVRWMLILSVILIACLAAALSYIPGVIYLVLPILLALSINVQLLGVTIASSIVLIIIFVGTARGFGPLASQDALDTSFRLIVFAVATAQSVLGMSLQGRHLKDTEHTSKRWQDIARHDALTGLLNRRDFLPRLDSEQERSLRGDQPYAIAMLDLDHFKIINDTYGHGAGDFALQSFAEITLHNCRTIDTVARMGGEEFCILLPECSATQAAVAMERLRTIIERTPIIWHEQIMHLTVSIGVAALTTAQESASQVLLRADRAMYRAKQTGRNQVVIDAH